MEPLYTSHLILCTAPSSLTCEVLVPTPPVSCEIVSPWSGTAFNSPREVVKSCYEWREASYYLTNFDSRTLCKEYIMQNICCSFSHKRPLDLLSFKGENGIFNVRNNLNERCAHKSETDTNESAPVLMRKNFWKKSLTLSLPGIDSTLAAFSGFSVLTIELRDLI